MYKQQNEDLSQKLTLSTNTEHLWNNNARTYLTDEIVNTGV